MLQTPDYLTARTLLLETAAPVGTQEIPLSRCGGRVLAQEATAAWDVPPFDRSPYDGYALCVRDIRDASSDAPVTLAVVEEIPAGAVPTRRVERGTAVKILTGAPIPEGADAVIPYERTRFDKSSVTLFAPSESGANIIRAGEDVRKGQVLVSAGAVIDAGLAGTLAAQGIVSIRVYRRPVVGIVSTGNEVAEAGTPLKPGKVWDSNRFMLECALSAAGCEARYLGLAGDRSEEIALCLEKGMEACDAVLLTGGVSVGDYDMTPDAMERAGVELLVRGVAMKPGMACAYGRKAGKLVCGLSGNPASSMTNFYAVVLPAIRKLTGRRDVLPREITVILGTGFRKRSPATRFLRGRLDLSDGRASLLLPEEQGNVVISSAIGCDAMAVVPAGSGPLPAGTRLKGFLL